MYYSLYFMLHLRDNPVMTRRKIQSPSHMIVDIHCSTLSQTLQYRPILSHPTLHKAKQIYFMRNILCHWWTTWRHMVSNATKDDCVW